MAVAFLGDCFLLGFTVSIPSKAGIERGIHYTLPLLRSVKWYYLINDRVTNRVCLYTTL